MPDFLTVNARVHHFRFRPGGGKQAIVFANSLGTDLRIWDDVINVLPAETPVLTYDKSGHGLSAGCSETIDEFAADLAALMDALDVRDAMICGVSVGGMIAQALAAARPDLVAGLVLCNTGYRIGTQESWADRIAALETGGIDALADGILERWFAPAFGRNNPDQLAGYRMMLSRTPVAGYRAVCAAIRDADLAKTTAAITCPTLCIAGGDDQATPAEVVRRLAERIPGAGYTCLEEVGHLPCIEAPDQLAQHITAHLEILA